MIFSTCSISLPRPATNQTNDIHKHCSFLNPFHPFLFSFFLRFVFALTLSLSFPFLSSFSLVSFHFISFCFSTLPLTDLLQVLLAQCSVASRYFLLPEVVHYGAWPILLSFISSAPAKIASASSSSSSSTVYQDLLLAAADVMRALLTLKGSEQPNQVSHEYMKASTIRQNTPSTAERRRKTSCLSFYPSVCFFCACLTMSSLFYVQVKCMSCDGLKIVMDTLLAFGKSYVN